MCAFTPTAQALESTPTEWRPKLLMIDDEADYLHLMEWGARRSGLFHSVESILGSEAAANRLDQGGHELSADIVMLDWRMPQISGLEFVSILRSHGRFRTTPVVALSGTLNDIDKTAALGAGCCAFLLKPAGLESMLAVFTHVRGYCAAHSKS